MPSGKRLVVVDNGSGFVKCGFGGSHFPTHMFPSIVGRPIVRSAKQLAGGEIKDILLADECTSHRHLLDITYPMENGVVRNWDDMNLIWKYTFGPERLDIVPEESRLLLTEPSMNSAANRQKVVETMFEDYKFDSLFMATQAVLALYANGMKTGICVDSGDGVTHICPVFGGRILHHLSRRLDIAGRHITRELNKLLLLRGYSFNHSADFEVMRQLKEQQCYVAYDVAVDERLIKETTVLNKQFLLPDGRVITVAEELFRAPEVLFQPSLLGQEVAGISETLFNAVQAADIDIRTSLFKNILVTGGTTLLPGFAERLEREVNQLYLQRVLKGDESKFEKFRTQVQAPPRRMHLVFEGGAMLAELMDDYEDMWLTQKEYEEEGVIRCLQKMAKVTLG